jgi:hypothetical protein
VRFEGWLSPSDGPDAARREADALYEAIRAEARAASWYVRATELPTAWKVFEESTPEVQAAVVQVACEEIRAGARGAGHPRWMDLAADIIRNLVRRRLAAPPTRVAAILDICTELAPSYEHFLHVNALIGLASRPPAIVEVEALKRLRDATARSQSAPARRIVTRIDSLLDDEPQALAPRGPWSEGVLRDIAQDADDQRDLWCQLLVHVTGLRTAEPSRRWKQQLESHVGAIGRAGFLKRSLEWIARGPQPNGPVTPQVPEGDADYLRGVVWTLADFEDNAVPRALADLAEQCFRKVPNYGPVSARVGNACIRVLSLLPGLEPIAQLGRLRSRVKYVVGARLVDRALNEAAERAGISADELQDIAVPTFDLDAEGCWRGEVGGFVAEIRITATESASLAWQSPDGVLRRSVPALVRQDHAPALQSLKKTVKDISRLLPTQKVRLERMLEGDRLIPWPKWQARYQHHPLIGHMVRRLIWQFQTGESVRTGAVQPDGQLVDSNDAPIDDASEATLVRLWHPLGADPRLVQGWRSWLERHQVVQPFKQAHREVYALTDAERATDVYSNRFAGHVLRQHQLAALCREREWAYHLQGDWDSANVPIRRLPRLDLQVEFWVEAPRGTGPVAQSGVFQHVLTDQVRFVRQRAPLQLADVPPIVFSELMRDIDLFVGVCSVGNDPTWADRGPGPFNDY